MTKLLSIVLLLLSCGVVEAGNDLKLDFNCTMVNGTCAEFGEKTSGKKVVIPYDDFIVMLSKVEHKDKLLNQCAAERGILIKLNDENGTIKRLNLQQIEALEGEAEAHRKLGETQEQIVQAMEQQVSGITGELTREKRLSRYKSEAFWLGVIVVGLWAIN